MEVIWQMRNGLRLGSVCVFGYLSFIEWRIRYKMGKIDEENRKCIGAIINNIIYNELNVADQEGVYQILSKGETF